jgi:hypothetical protein
MRVGGAASVRQQAGVEGLRGGPAIDAEAVSDPHGDQRPVQAVLEREGHAEIGRQAERGDYLGCPDRVVALRPDCHAPQY